MHNLFNRLDFLAPGNTEDPYEDPDFPDVDLCAPTSIVVNTDGINVSFTATAASGTPQVLPRVGAALIKGGSATNVYLYEPQVQSDNGLVSPNNPSGGPAGLSNIGGFCWNPEIEVEDEDEDEDEGQWCSPGYWRQTQHLHSWDATGIMPGALYSDYFDAAPARSKKGVTDSASVNPTLWQVLQAPQYYGGDAFNMVGDLLSTAHPDVEFGEVRVEDSCPLN